LVRTKGRLGDGKPVSHAGYLSAREDWPLFAIVARKPELSQLGGMLTFRDKDGISDFDGILERTGASGGAGMGTARVSAIGSVFKLVKGSHALAGLAATGGGAICQLEDQLTGQSDYWPVRWDMNGRIGSVVGSRRFAGSVNAKTGYFKGTAQDVTGGLKVGLEGVVFQKQQLIGGSYRGKSEAGAVIINAGAW